MLTRLLIAATLALFFLPANVAQGEPPASPAKSSVAPEVCHEDESCFRWTTMGNGQRGVWVKARAIRVGKQHPDGKRRHRVVTVCQFARLQRDGLLDSRTERLPGDGSARRICQTD